MILHLGNGTFVKYCYYYYYYDSLTKEAVAEAVPHACCLVPGPPALDARRERKVYSNERHQQVAQTYVYQQQIGGCPQPLEAAVEYNDNKVVAEAEHADSADSEGKKLVRANREKVLLRAPLGSGVVGRIHVVEWNRVSRMALLLMRLRLLLVLEPLPATDDSSPCCTRSDH